MTNSFQKLQMKRPGIIAAVLFGLTTLQVVWNWLREDRQFTRLNLVVWLFLLGMLSAYYLLLRSERFSEPVKKISRWVFSQITERRVVTLGILLLGAYTVWYVNHVWGESLIGKDFGAFFYRYILLHELFPSLVGYNPMLNGGERTIELLTTGSVNLFLLTYPIAALFSIEAGFKSQPIFMTLLLPALFYLSGRLVRFSHAESLFSAALALVMTPIGHMGFGQVFFHGSLPYIFSCGITVFVFALSYRIFVLGRDAGWAIPLIILVGSLASLHPIFFVIMGPVALATVFFGRISAKRKMVYSAMIGVGLLAVNGIWIHELMSYDQGQLISTRFALSGQSLVAWAGRLEKNFFGFQVSLVIASTIGLRRLVRDTKEAEKRSLGRLLLFAIIYYTFLSSMGHFMVPGLQPERFVVPLSFFLTLALGASMPIIKSLWTRMDKEGTPTSLAFNAALFALAIFVSVPYSVFIVGFPTAPATTFELVRWLRENVNDNERVFFYIPDRGGHYTALDGQLPFYQVQAQRSLMGVPASNMYTSIKWIQEIGECLKNHKTASTCRDLYNIHYAITFSETVNGRSVSAPQEHVLDDFKLLKSIGSIQIHKSARSGSYFLLGNGEVKQYLNRISVTAEPSEVVVLKFFWAPGLRTDPPLLVEPYPLPNGRAFIKVRSNFYRNFDIVYGKSDPGLSPLREIHSSLRTATVR